MKLERMHHIACNQTEVGKYVILTGDPGRVETIAKYLDDAKHMATNREFITYTGTLCGEQVSVTSTGIGGPSASIAMEELVKLGVHTFIRVGTCGGIDNSLIPGSLIIPTGAIRKDGTGNEYVPIEFPAVPDYDVVTALKEASSTLKYESHLGIVECKDSYYGQHEPDRMPVSRMLKEKWDAWKLAGAIGSEMESSTLFIVASVLHVRCGTVLLLSRNRERENEYNTGLVRITDVTAVSQTAVQAIKLLIEKDRLLCHR